MPVAPPFRFSPGATMSERRPSGQGPDLSELLTGLVAESLGAAWASSDDPAGVWTRSGSVKLDARTLADLDRARTATRRLIEGSSYDDGNEFAIGAAENRVNYVVGERGLKYDAVPAPGATPDPALVAETQQFIDAFSELNNLSEMEGEALHRGDRDGEAFLRLFPGDGIPEVRFVEPERVAPPVSRAARAGGAETGEHPDAWGVRHADGDRGRREGYWVSAGDGIDPELVDEREIVHLKLNTTSECPRGWPTFEPVRRSLIRAEELLVAMTASGKVRAKIALITTIPGWTAAKADQLAARLTAKWQEQPSGEPPREESTEELPYGAHLRVREGTNIHFPPPGLGAAELVDAIQANLRTAGARLVMPEWMFSGLPDAKYSNAFVVEAPTLRQFKRLQRLLVVTFGEGRLGHRASLVWRAIRLAVAGGYLHPDVLHAVRIKCTAPSLEARDKSAEASANVAYITAGVKSRETCQEEIGVDPEREKARVKEEAKEFGAIGGLPASGK